MLGNTIIYHKQIPYQIRRQYTWVSTPPAKFLKELREYLNCDIVLKQENNYLFCIEIQDLNI